MTVAVAVAVGLAAVLGSMTLSFMRARVCPTLVVVVVVVVVVNVVVVVVVVLS